MTERPAAQKARPRSVTADVPADVSADVPARARKDADNGRDRGVDGFSATSQMAGRVDGEAGDIDVAGTGSVEVAAVEIAAVATPWCLYLIECRNCAYYAGITNKLDARYAAHVAGRGARYTRANPPLRLLGSRWFADRSAAARAEWQIRQLSRDGKLSFLADPADIGDA